MKRILVLGAGGFIGSHLVKRLKRQGHYVIGVDLKYPEFSESFADEFLIGDLRDPTICEAVINDEVDEIYQLAADMGGAGYLFSGENDFNVMHNSALINLNVVHFAIQYKVKKVFSHLLLVFTRSLISRTQLILTAKKVRPTRLIPIANMDGRKFFRNGCIMLPIATIN